MTTTLKNRRQRTPRFRCPRTLQQWRGAAFSIHMRTRRLLVVIVGGLLFLITCGWVGAGSTQYHVTGRIAWQGLQPEAASRGEFVSRMECSTYSFTVDVEGCRWSISLTPLKLYLPEEVDLPPGVGPGAGISRSWTTVVASDGHEFCMVLRGDSKSNSAASAMRGPGAAPFCVDRQIVMLWYLYASHCVIGGASSNLLVPMESLSGNPRVTRVPARWQLLSNFPKLPKLVANYGYYVHCDGGHEGQLDILPPQESRTNVVLTVNSSTNLRGATLPLMSSMHYYWVSRQDGRTKSAPHDMAVIEALLAEPIAQVPDYPPKLAGRCLVWDYRLSSTADSNLVAVKIWSDTGWPTEAMIEMQKARQPPTGNAETGKPQN